MMWRCPNCNQLLIFRCSYNRHMAWCPRPSVSSPPFIANECIECFVESTFRTHSNLLLARCAHHRAVSAAPSRADAEDACDRAHDRLDR